MTRRGAVYISPTEFGVPEGRMVDPETSMFAVSWQNGYEGLIEDAVILGGEAAVAWGRERADEVYIRLGHRGDTNFSAGTSQGDPVDYDDDPLPLWPPSGPPREGWWTPPELPTLAEVKAVADEVARGKLSEQEGASWAFERMSYERMSEGIDSEVHVALAKLTNGWVSRSGRVERGSGPIIVVEREEH